MKYTKIFLLIIFLMLASGGCLMLRQGKYSTSRVWHGIPYEITNFYRDPEINSIGIRRVAVLPFINESDYTEASGKVLKVFVAELKKTGLFSVVVANSGDEALMLASIKNSATIDYNIATGLARRLNVDALVVGRVTDYFPYHRVPVLGLHVVMLHPEGHTVVWEVDELFDSSDYSVINAIRNYFNSEFNDNASDFNFELFLYSITRYSQFVTHEIVNTLL